MMSSASTDRSRSSDSPSLFELMRRFTATMANRFEINDVLYDLCDHAALLLGAAGAGVCVGADADGGAGVRFVTATSAGTADMERVQEETDQGPCMLAYRTGEAVRVPSIGSTTEWPAYRAAAAKVGLVSVVGLPLALNGHMLGALNVYDDKERSWTGEDLEASHLLADMATAYILRAGELLEARTLSVQLQRALDSRVVIEQAKGMVARDHGVGVDEAFELLRGQSRRTNTSLRSIATAVVEGDFKIVTMDGSGQSDSGSAGSPSSAGSH